MTRLNDRITEVVQLLKKTSTSFYQQKNQEGYLSLDQTIQSLMQLITEFSANKEEGNGDTIDENRLNIILGQAMTAIEMKDMILLSDLFTFELKPLLEQFQCNISDRKY